MSSTVGLAIALAVVTAGIAGWGITYFVLRRRVRELEQDNARLQGEIEVRIGLLQETDNLKQQFSEQFAHISSQVLERNSRQFLQLAEQNLKQYQEGAKQELSKREQAVENLVKPIRDQLEKTDQQLRQIEKERQEAYGSLAQHLRAMAETQSNLQAETANLVQALRRPEIRGQWGELTLRRVVELAGMVEHCDFDEQQTASGQNATGTESTSRPDLIVRMPEAREIVVDAKTPLDAYISATQSADPDERDRHMQRFARHVRDKVRELSAKAYWSQFERSPEFVVLFIPGEQFLGAALDINPELQEEALRQKVILATPNNLVALLKTIAFGWRQQAVAENAERIRQEGRTLYERLVTFTEHLGKVGKNLRTSVDNYNRAVGSLEHQLLPSARRFTEMGIQPRKELDELTPIDTTTRQVTQGDGQAKAQVEAQDDASGDTTAGNTTAGDTTDGDSTAGDDTNDDAGESEETRRSND